MANRGLSQLFSAIPMSHLFGPYPLSEFCQVYFWLGRVNLDTPKFARAIEGREEHQIFLHEPKKFLIRKKFRPWEFFLIFRCTCRKRSWSSLSKWCVSERSKWSSPKPANLAPAAAIKTSEGILSISQKEVAMRYSHFNPQASVAQKVADEVVFRRFQGEGVEFFKIGPHWPPSDFWCASFGKYKFKPFRP